jgi:hypothetical protein
MIRGSSAEEALRQKLHKIEALFAGAATVGESRRRRCRGAHPSAPWNSRQH